MAEAAKSKYRVWLAWLFGALCFVAYFALPENDAPSSVGQNTPSAPSGSESTSEQRKPEIIEITPADPAPGSAIVIAYAGLRGEADKLRVIAGKEELKLLSLRPNSVVAQLPNNAAPGRLKIRVAVAEERSKPYDVRVKAVNFRKPFRNLIGGIAFLVFGIRTLTQAVREAAGISSALRLARFARRRVTALFMGGFLGALVQSTTAAAGLLAGFVGSGVLAVEPAATAFIGAGVGVAALPLLVTGAIEPHLGLIVVAVGVLGLSLASDRRSRALAQLLLGAGLLAFGLQVMRPAFEPLALDSRVLSAIDGLRAESVWGALACMLMGALFVAIFQGPAPLLMLVLAIAETTGHWDMRTALTLLSGSSLGSAVGALLMVPAGGRVRRLAQINLIVGAFGTALALLTVPFFSGLSDQLIAGHPHEMQWGKRVLMPNIGFHLVGAFMLSQLVGAAASLPVIRACARFLPESKRSRGVAGGAHEGARAQAQVGLTHVLATLELAIEPLCSLAVSGVRAAGRTSEHRLSEARDLLSPLLEGPVTELSHTPGGAELGRLAFASLQLLRAIEDVLRHAESLTDNRLSSTLDVGEVPPLAADDERVLRRIHELLLQSLKTVSSCLRQGQAADLETARAREIMMNRLESEARGSRVLEGNSPELLRNHLGVLELVDAYESAGNQAYRLLESIGNAFVHRSSKAPEMV